MTKIKLIPIDEAGGSRNGTLHTNYNTICKVVGFKENVEDDPDKVEASWGFEDDQGRQAFIWCYKQGKHFCNDWSTDGDQTLIDDLFH